MTKKQGVVLLSGGAVLLLVVLLMTLLPATETMGAPDMPVGTATPTLPPSLSGGNDCYCARPPNAPPTTDSPADATE